MERPAFKVRVRLVPSDEGGRGSSIRGPYHPIFEVDGAPDREPMPWEGELRLSADELAPGADGDGTVEPLRPELWDRVGVGARLPFREGAAVVGHATVTERVWPAAFTPATAAFVRAARELCALVQGASSFSLEERLRRARAVLLPLYAAATELPAATKLTELDTPSELPPEAWAGFAEHDLYWEVFDPYELSEPVAGSLSDDLLDIFRDVRRGLWFWDRHEIADAVWEWRFSFDSHWGAHAADALRALHRACGRVVG